MRLPRSILTLGLILLSLRADRIEAEEPFVVPEPDRLVESLRRGDFLMRSQILRALGKEPQRAKYEKELRTALKDPERSMRQMAAVGLVQLGHADQPIQGE